MRKLPQRSFISCITSETASNLRSSSQLGHCLVPCLKEQPAQQLNSLLQCRNDNTHNVCILSRDQRKQRAGRSHPSILRNHEVFPGNSSNPSLPQFFILRKLEYRNFKVGYTSCAVIIPAAARYTTFIRHRCTEPQPKQTELFELAPQDTRRTVVCSKTYSISRKSY